MTSNKYSDGILWAHQVKRATNSNCGIITRGGLAMTALNSLDMFPGQQYKII